MTNPIITSDSYVIQVDVNAVAVAAQSAAAAQAAAAAAASSATTATTEAGVATTQAGNASTSATNSAGSAAAAATSATNAANSAATSTTNSNNVSALLASFRGVFLGAFANDAAAVTFANANSITIAAGLMYENTTEDKFRIYSGSAWGDYDASAQASQSAAALSASNAASSASAASTSETNAANSASASSTSATNSANSATASSNSASAASTSATNAANSATAAANSAASMNGELALTVASGTNNLTAAQAANAVYKLTGALTANATIVIPSAGTTPHNFSVQNSTTGAFGVTISVQGQAPSVAVVQGLSTALFSDATGVYSLSAPAGMQFSKQTLLSGAGTTTFDTSYLGSIVYFTAASQIVKLPLAASYAAGEGVATKNIAASVTGQVQVQGSDSGDATFPFTQNYGDTIFWVSDGVSKWYRGWYTNAIAPTFSSKVLVGQTDNGVDAIQATGSIGATGAGGVLRAIGAAAAAAAQLVSTALGLDAVVTSNNPFRILTNALERLRVTGGGRLLVNTTTDDGANQIQVAGGVALHTGAASAQVTLDANAAQYREVMYETGGVLRWAQGADNSAEGGSNAGSNWFLSRYSDAGAALDNPIAISRSTGVAMFSQRPVFGANTPWDAGNFTPANYLLLSGASAMTGTLTLASGGLTFADGSQQASAAAGKNRIINGSCIIKQRSSLVAANNTIGYGGPDRYLAQNSGAGGQFTQSQGTITYGGLARSAVVQTVNTVIASSSSANFWLGICQPIEGVYCYDLLGSPATASFIFNASRAGTYSFSLRDYSVSQSFVTTFNYTTANTPQKITIPIPSIPTNLTTPNSTAGGMYMTVGAINTGTYQTATLGSWQTGSYFAASGALNWSIAANDFIAATEIQLEKGSVATPFERRPHSQVLDDCLRYYETQTSTVGLGVYSSGVAETEVIGYSVLKRVVPTVTIDSVANFVSVGYNSSHSISAYTGGFKFIFNTSTAVNTIGVGDVTWEAYAEL